jgi:hypothetical protein
MKRLLGLLAVAVLLVVFASPMAQSQNLVNNQPVNVAATALPTNGVTSASLGQPAVAVYTVWFTNSTASAVFCGLYGTAPTLGTTNPIGGQVEVGAGTTQPVYFGPTNGVNKNYFANGIWAGCSTAYLGSTGVATSVVGVAVTFL